jgi:hypothetical protein
MLKVLPTADLQSEVIERVREICGKLGLAEDNVRRASRVLLGDKYVPQLKLPTSARVVRWADRRGDDIPLSPLEFFRKHWARYDDEGILDQRDFRRLDNGLFEAIRIHCRNKKLDPKDFLPPPARGKAKQSSPPKHVERAAIHAPARPRNYAALAHDRAPARGKAKQSSPPKRGERAATRAPARPRNYAALADRGLRPEI